MLAIVESITEVDIDASTLGEHAFAETLAKNDRKLVAIETGAVVQLNEFIRTARSVEARRGHIRVGRRCVVPSRLHYNPEAGYLQNDEVHDHRR